MISQLQIGKADQCCMIRATNQGADFIISKNCTLFFCGFFSLGRGHLWHSVPLLILENMSSFPCPSHTLPSKCLPIYFSSNWVKKMLQCCFSWQMLPFTSSTFLTLGNAFLSLFHLCKLDAGKHVRCSSSATGIVQCLRIIDILHKPIYPGSSRQYRM